MKIKFVYQSVVETQEAIPNISKAKRKVIPTGKAHFFTLKVDGEIRERSLCGVSISEISEKPVTRDERVKSLPVCEACATAWKNNSQSEWATWSNSVRVQA